jgi:hypothetical protein
MSIIKDGAPDRKPRIKYEKPLDLSGSDLLSAAEKSEIRKKAKLKVQNELKDRAEKQLLEHYMKEERQAFDPDEKLVPIFLQLAGHSNYIMLDGVQYYHERVHHVTVNVFNTLAEIQARGWAHEDQTEVRDTRTRRRDRPPSHIGIGNFQDNRRPRDLVVSSGQLQGTSPSALLGMHG